VRVVVFCHSLVSDWNHGNAHFLRGITTELLARGVSVRVYEPRDAWSVQQLVAEHGEEPIRRFQAACPELVSTRYDLATLDLDEATDQASLVLVHEWSEPELVRRLGQHRTRTGRYRLLFHDTHHRAVTEAAAMARYALEPFDGVLAFGQVLRDLYLRRKWAQRAWVWHEAADVRRFRPVTGAPLEGEVVWIGNWGDDERSAELEEFLLEPVRTLGLRAKVYGVRYPLDGLRALARSGLEYGGWLPNLNAPAVFARYRATVHVPRRPYARALPGIPTIRVFEALACGIPLVSAPWTDTEQLFTPGKDFLVARDGAEMRAHLSHLFRDPGFAAELAAQGLATVRARHTCAHRVDELFAILGELGGTRGEAAA
jgi:spore maturation protein CgeB